MATLIRSLDWSTTQLGPREHWPQSLRTATSLVVEARFPAALLWGPDLLFLYNDAYRIIAANKHPTALGKPAREVWPEVWHINATIFEAVMQRGEALYFEDKLFTISRHGELEDAYFTLSYSPVRDDLGAVGGTVVLLEETTARVRSELALKKTQRLLAEGQRIAHLGTFEYTAETKATSWSEEEFRIYGLDPAQPSPSYQELLAHCIHPDDVALLDETFARALATGGPYELDHRVVRPDRSVRWVRDRALPEFDPSGKLVRYIGATLDITESKLAEEALREADRRKNDFLATLSHELRNPLTPIRNSLHILDRVAPDSAPAQRAQAVMARQVEHLARLVDDLLDVSRITRGRAVLRPERLELGELVRQTVEDHRAEFAEHRVALVMTEAPGEAWVLGDRTRLAQVLGNLLQNARKFTPAGGSTHVGIALHPAERTVSIEVRDTGRGIAPEVLPRLFEAFAQADSSLDRQTGGLGLGLCIAKGLVDLHGGEIRAQSEGAGAGAAFTVTLPLAPAFEGRSSRGAESAREVPLRVLVIEDNADAAQSLGELLALDGHSVQLAFNGPEGVRRARTFRPEIVLCDIGLPDMDGYAVARALRVMPELAGARLVALTGYTQAEDVETARAAGFDDHVGKPPDLEKLAEVMGLRRAKEQSPRCPLSPHPRLFPVDAPRPTTSEAERKLWSALKQKLPVGWRAWHALKLRSREGHYERDFVLAVPDRGLLVLDTFIRFKGL